MKKQYIFLTMAALAMAATACGKKPEADAAPGAAAAISGETVYNEKGCVTCHGAQGKGDGPVGAALKPKPRNFADAKWKNGTDLASVIKAIETGIAGSGMAPYKGVLSDEEIKAVAEHVRKLGGKN
ncbi:c-type cytochrome [Turneriella parva]|uniref:Cytochrome c class I n=1 Tax=Turneriella parva (strain ATCC BAA-1111 / DSM 21527 / NCTC 11395 / H) TaxID=869212 RepID=I4B989_TURPD|nr:c-type cytochrome [Turneriella parva]AFM13846.1 cytochrome c class I [Turneriella parva DSM 21527]